MNKVTYTETIPESLQGKRLDQVLAELFPDYSRSQWQQWIREGFIKLNQQIITKPREKVKGAEQLEVDAQITAHALHQAQNIPLDIVYEDESLMLINKPAGLIVHPGAGNPDHTLLNALLHHAPELETLPRAGIIHRLDKDTSGLLVIAKTLPVHHALIKAMQERQIKREYAAIVQGVMVAGGTIDAPIGRHTTQRTKMNVTRTGKPAITHYRIIKKFKTHTYVRVILETGRTHQIRVHMAHINYPIVGDSLYSKRHLPAKISETLRATLSAFPRQALHAERLTLIHPVTLEECSWQATLPDDIKNLLIALEEDMNAQ